MILLFLVITITVDANQIIQNLFYLDTFVTNKLASQITSFKISL